MIDADTFVYLCWSSLRYSGSIVTGKKYPISVHGYDGYYQWGEDFGEASLFMSRTVVARCLNNVPQISVWVEEPSPEDLMKLRLTL